MLVPYAGVVWRSTARSPRREGKCEEVQRAHTMSNPGRHSEAAGGVGTGMVRDSGNVLIRRSASHGSQRKPLQSPQTPYKVVVAGCWEQ